jgi:hypothetical protein
MVATGRREFSRSSAMRARSVSSMVQLWQFAKATRQSDKLIAHFEQLENCQLATLPAIIISNRWK